jgi:hypothetical protein
LDGLEE